MAESEEARRGTVERLIRASSAALSALPQKGRKQHKTFSFLSFFLRKESKFVGIIHLYWTCNWIRPDPNTKSLGLEGRNGREGAGVPVRVLVAGEGPEDGDLRTWRRTAQSVCTRDSLSAG